ncbi:MAG: hypothetical protein AB1489_27165 [Acidobacteriota bacterium]
MRKVSNKNNPDASIANTEYIGKDMGIFLGGAVCHSAVAVRMLHGICDSETAKAIRLKLNKGFIWIPKKGLIKTNYDDIFKLAHWVNLDERIVERNQTISGVSSV